MGEFSDFPKLNKFYFTRRGKFKVVAVKGKKVTIEWQDNKERVAIESRDLKKQLIPERYAGDPDTIKVVEETKPRFRPPADEDDQATDEE